MGLRPSVSASMLPIVDWPLCLRKTLVPFTSRLPGIATLGPSCTPNGQSDFGQKTFQRRKGSDVVIVQGCSLNRQLAGQRRRWESNPLESCFADSRRTVWLQRHQSVLARNRTWTSTFAGLHANPAHPEDVNLAAARRGVEPRLAVPKTRSGTLAGRVSIPTWIWTRAATFGGLRAIRYTIGTCIADDWICTSICRFTKPVPSAIEPRRRTSTSARSRTPWSSFGGCRLTQEHTRRNQKGYPKGVEPLPPGSQPGVQRPLHHRHHLNQQLDQDLNPEILVRTEA